MGAAIATWFRLRLPFCGPGSEFQAHHLRFFQFVLLKLLLELEKNENERKEAGIGPYLKKGRGLAHIIFLKNNIYCLPT